MMLNTLLDQPVTLIGLLIFCSLVPIFVIIGTCFLKFSLIFSLLRSAIGLQQVPPNMALYALSLMMTCFAMAPVGIQMYENCLVAKISWETPVSLEQLDKALLEPYRHFLKEHASAEQTVFFQQMCQKSLHEHPDYLPSAESLVVLLPAFAVTQLIEGFKIGLLLYFPFIVIDLVVSNVLLAMGMMMVSPLTIALPFKLLVFVLVNGWDKLLAQLLIPYL